MKAGAPSMRLYLEQGGFPEYLEQQDKEVLQRLFTDVLYRDISVRYAIRNVNTLTEIGLFLLSNIGKEMSLHNIKKTFSVGSVNSIADYVSWFEDCYLLFKLPRFSWSLKSRSVNPKKMYGIDTGLIRANSLSFSGDDGRMLENTAFLHLRRKCRSIFYFREKKECDFIIHDADGVYHAFQVCYKLTGENLTREIEGLTEAMDFFNLTKGTIVTYDQEDKYVVNGKTINVVASWKWMNLP